MMLALFGYIAAQHSLSVGGWQKAAIQSTLKNLHSGYTRGDTEKCYLTILNNLSVFQPV